MKVLVVKNLKKKFYDKFILKNINFSINKGEVVAFLGKNGEGKSTTIKCILNLISADSGNIEFFEGKYKDPFKKIGFLHESPRFWEDFTAYEFLNLMKGFYNFLDGNRIDEVLNDVDLHNVKDKKISEFSRGMKQRLGIAQAILNDPEFIIFDEPMTALDPVGKLKIKRIIKNMKNMGKSVFFSSHQLLEIQEIADRFILLKDGEIVISKKMSEIDNLERFFIDVNKYN